MRVARWMAVAAVGLAATAAHAQEAEQQASGGQDLAQRCIALLAGEVGDAEASALRSRCEDLLRRAGAQPGEARAEAGASAEQPSEGPRVMAAFEQAGRELVGAGDRRALGLDQAPRDRRSLLTSNPIGWFSGLGVNATFSRALEDLPKLSWLASARYARANASNGNVTTVGLGTGADFFIVGRNNEGLRIGPRLDLSFGDESFGGNTTYARLGLSGEVGYNFIASNGISLLGALGLGGRLLGDSQNEEFTSFTGGEFGPYVKLGLGYAF